MDYGGLRGHGARYFVLLVREFEFRGDLFKVFLLLLQRKRIPQSASKIPLSSREKAETYLLRLQLPLQRLLPGMQPAEAVDALLVLLADFLFFTDFRFFFAGELAVSVSKGASFL